MADNVCFVDTSGFYAWLVAKDPRHVLAHQWMNRAQAGEVKLTSSDYVLDETATLLSARGLRNLAARFLRAMEATRAVNIIWCDPDLFRRATDLFIVHHDKAWSFTDCLSLVMMDDARIDNALTTDRHFEQAGKVALLR